MSLVLIISDIHFDLNLGKSYPTSTGTSVWFDDQLALVDAHLAKFQAEDGKRVIINGDLFEKKSEINTTVYNAVYALFSKWEQAGLCFIFNTGNHDKLRDSAISLYPFSRIGFVVTKATGFFIDDALLRVIPYGGLRLDVMEAPNRRTNVLVLHEDIDGLLLGPLDRRSKSPILKSSLRSWDYVFNGHIHKPQDVGNIVNIGSPMIQDWGEVGEIKRVVLYDTVTNSFKSRLSRGPSFFEVVDPSKEELKRIAGDIHNLYRITLTTATSVGSVMEECANLSLNHISWVLPSPEARSQRMGEVSTDEEEIAWYVDNSDTVLDKDKLKMLGRKLYASGC